ncbi:hypothetical protein [Sphingomonas sp. R86521]
MQSNWLPDSALGHEVGMEDDADAALRRFAKGRTKMPPLTQTNG